jgi:hypothetical protein
MKRTEPRLGRAPIEGDTLSFTRLQTMLDLTPGNPITCLRKLEDAGYLTGKKTEMGPGRRPQWL